MEDITVNTSKLLESINWINAFITCFAAFLGAYFAYCYSMRIEKKKANRQLRADFCALSSQMYLNLSSMLIFKQAYLDKIANAYNTKDLTFIFANINMPNTCFSFDINKYVFLNDCNPCFLSELDTIHNMSDQFHQLWQMYEKQLYDFNQTEVKNDPKTLENLKKTFETVLMFYNQFCIRLYVLDEKLSACYKRFFNVNYYGDKDLKSNIDITQYIPNALINSEFTTIREQFDAYWKPQKTLFNDLSFWVRKLKNKTIRLIAYLGLNKKNSHNVQNPNTRKN